LADGRRLSSVSAVVRDPHGRAEVVLCINVNRTAFDDAARVLVGFAAPAEGRPGPLFEPDWRESVNDIVGGYVRESGVTVDRFSREDRLTMLSRLDAAGVFSRQRSVPAVAQALRVSRSMTYQLLAHLRRGVRTDADAS
jgi:predicted transcriptional regulator YheO